MKDYRLVVLGSGGVGKTSLVNRFLKGIFLDNYTPTVEDIHRPIIQLPDGDIHGIEILDTAGLHQFPAMRRLSIQSGRAFVVVFSLADYSTLEEALTFIDAIRQIKGDDAPVVIVGNKIDLCEGRSVTTSAVVKLAEARRCTYVETSARSDYNIQKVFLELLSEVFREEKSHSEQEEQALWGNSNNRVVRLSIRLRRAMSRNSYRRSISASSDDSSMSNDDCDINSDNNDITTMTDGQVHKAACSIM